jgi:hypothetical protein
VFDNKLISRGDFEWPATLFTEVFAPNWDPEPICGKGLHALLPGQQAPGKWYENGAWLLVSADQNTIVNLEDGAKCKVPRMTVLAIAYTSGPTIIPQLLKDLGYDNPIYKAAIIDMTEATNVSVGKCGVAVVGFRSTATAGDLGIAIATESWGTAIAGFRGTAIGLHHNNIVAAGAKGIIQVQNWGDDRIRVHVGYIGETLDNQGQVLEPNQLYRSVFSYGKLQWEKVRSIN